MLLAIMIKIIYRNDNDNDFDKDIVNHTELDSNDTWELNEFETEGSNAFLNLIRSDKNIMNALIDINQIAQEDRKYIIHLCKSHSPICECCELINRYRSNKMSYMGGGCCLLFTSDVVCCTHA